MKIILALLPLAFPLLLSAGEVRVKIKGMVCSLCAQGIQKKISPLPEVKELSVKMDEKLVIILERDGKSISDEVIKNLISEAGYYVADIERK
jgi:copper chaperone CopZ